MKRFVAEYQNRHIEFSLTPRKNNRFQAVFPQQEFTLNARLLDKHHYSILCGHESHDISLVRQGNFYQVFVNGSELGFVLKDERALRQESFGSVVVAGSGQVVSPMPGKVIEVKVSVGQKVRVGDGLVVVEAMKMQNELKSQRAGVVKEVLVRAGQSVEERAVLVVVD